MGWPRRYARHILSSHVNMCHAYPQHRVMNPPTCKYKFHLNNTVNCKVVGHIFSIFTRCCGCGGEDVLMECKDVSPRPSPKDHESDLYASVCRAKPQPEVLPALALVNHVSHSEHVPLEKKTHAEGNAGPTIGHVTFSR